MRNLKLTLRLEINLAIVDYQYVTIKAGFVKLSAENQDVILTLMDTNKIPDWPADAGQPAQFFGLIRALTIIGFLADPKYGGNKNHIGWKVAGYLGPSHHRGGYSDNQMMGIDAIKPIWKIK